MDDESILVSIGLPTYNRAGTLRKAIDSALAQDHGNIELVISDNGSTDETEAICREYAAADSRVKYLRQSSNLGPTPNFLLVVEEASADYFMWLCDDDWLDTNYVSECLRELVADPGVVLVGGISKYYRGEVYQFTGLVMNLDQDDRVKRVITYYDTVDDNGIYFGLWRRAEVARLPCVNTMGNDWLTLAAAAFSGKFQTISSTCIHRDLGGSTVSYAAIAEQMELPDYERRFPHLSIAVNAVYDVLARAEAFQVLTPFQRLILATRIFALIVGKYVIRGTLISVFVKLRSMVIHDRSGSPTPPV